MKQGSKNTDFLVDSSRGKHKACAEEMNKGLEYLLGYGANHGVRLRTATVGALENRAEEWADGSKWYCWSNLVTICTP